MAGSCSEVYEPSGLVGRDMVACSRHEDDISERESAHKVCMVLGSLGCRSSIDVWVEDAGLNVVLIVDSASVGGKVSVVSQKSEPYLLEEVR